MLTKISQIVLGVLCLSLTTAAQENWQLGVEATPSYYVLLNKVDWASIHEVPQIPDLFDVKGFTGGVRLSVDLGDYFGMTTGLRYNWGRQDYKEPQTTATSASMYSSLHYLQLPILFSLGTSNQYDSRFYFNLGVTVNYLLHYEEHWSQNKLGQENYGFWHYEGNTYSQIEYGSTDNTILSYSIDHMYKMFMLSAIAEVGYKRTFDNAWGLSIAMQGQYGLTNPENREAKFYGLPEDFSPMRLWYLKSGGKWGNVTTSVDERPPTHPLHIGVLFGVYYQFGYR